MAELWLIGERYAKLAPARDRLNAQLNVEVLLEPEQRHASYGAACQRYDRWGAELHRYDMHVARLVAQLAKHLGALSTRNRETLTAHAGWATGEPEEVAAGMWQRAKTGAGWPSGESGFDLAPLRAWIAGQMTAEREVMAA